jgi:mono/diheme cytochrome c family protein
VIERYVSPSEWRRLISALIVVLGFIAITAFFAFLIIPGQRYRANTSDETSIVAVQGESGWLDPTDYLPTRRVEIPPIDPATVMTTTPELMTRGKALYSQTCATCHGPLGHGDGPGARGLNPPPRNFTAPGGWKNGTRVEEIFHTLEVGVTGSAMVSYNYLRKQDRMALVHFVQSLGNFDHGTSEPKARAELERMFLTRGEVIPNRIPVRAAMQRLVEEYAMAPGPVAACLQDPKLQDAIVDAGRVSRTLSLLPLQDQTAFAQSLAFGVPNNGIAVAFDTYAANQWNQLRLCLAPR